MKFVINGELYSSKNSRQILFNKATGRIFVAKSKVAKSDEVELYNKLLIIRQSWDAVKKLYVKPYRLSFKIFRKTKRKFDYINIIQNLCDCMVKAGLLDDDDANNLIPFFEPYEVDSEHPRVEITFLE